MATDHRQEQPIPVISADRAKMLAQIDALEANGAPAESVAELRAGVHRLRLPEDIVSARVTHADAIVGAAQLTTIVKLFGERMAPESGDLLLRITAALAEAK